jgi:DNA-binding NarL/FixJ family response regulator
MNAPPLMPVMSILTKREIDVASALGAGYSYAEISRHLGITADTARKMTRAIAAKLVTNMGPQVRHPAGPRETVLRWLTVLSSRS